MKHLSFKEYIVEGDELDLMLSEALIQFNKNRDVKFGNVVILAGGAGSGKGFTLSNLIGLEGKVLDVDAVKQMAMRSEVIGKIAKDKTGVDISKLDLRNPENTSLIHTILSGDLGITDKREQVLFKSILMADPSRKPNLIFDVTLKDIKKLEVLSKSVQELGYAKGKIHIVWVLNDIEMAKQQNANRSRVVPSEILLATHKGAALTMAELLKDSATAQKYMDGDIWISFNKAKVDAALKKSDSGGSYVKDSNYIHVKYAGKPTDVTKAFNDEILPKIKSYIPNPEAFGESVEEINEAANDQKATLIRQTPIGIHTTKVTVIEVGRKDYAQFKNLPFVKYLEKGKRNPSSYMEANQKRDWVLAEGWDVPEVNAKANFSDALKPVKTGNLDDFIKSNNLKLIIDGRK